VSFNLHYIYIKDKYGDKAKLLFTDTNSQCYEIMTKDFYHNIMGNIESKFDTSDYPVDHPSGIPMGINKKVIGMFKNEACGKRIKICWFETEVIFDEKMHKGK